MSNHYLLVLLQAKDNIELMSPFLQFGLGGAVIAVLVLYIHAKDKSHKEERTEWRKDTLAQFDKNNMATQEVVEDFREALKQNSADLRDDREKFNNTLNKYSEVLGRINAKFEK